jgi:penicillin-binding protein-related factor A (putative recombinase)
MITKPLSSTANLGKPFEEALEAMHALYLSGGRAAVTRIPAPMQPVGKAVRGVFPAIYVKRGAPDFHAQVAGASLLFDAKSTIDPDRWPLADLPGHQAAAFDRHEAQQGRAFVLLLLGKVVFLLPWSALGPRWRRWEEGKAARGEASLTVADCDRLGYRCSWVDWLPTARSWLAASNAARS